MEVVFERGVYNFYVNGQKMPHTTEKSTLDIRIDSAKKIATVLEYTFATDETIQIFKGPVILGDAAPKDWWRGLSSLHQIQMKDAVNGGTLPDALQEKMFAGGYKLGDFAFLTD